MAAKKKKPQQAHENKYNSTGSKPATPKPKKKKKK